jgi:hypothetical protein
VSEPQVASRSATAAMNAQPATHPATNHAAFAEVHDPPETKQSPQSSMTRMTRMTRSRKSPPTKKRFYVFKLFQNICQYLFSKKLKNFQNIWKRHFFWRQKRCFPSQVF